jgi:hypothetical protein
MVGRRAGAGNCIYPRIMKLDIAADGPALLASPSGLRSNRVALRPVAILRGLVGRLRRAAPGKTKPDTSTREPVDDLWMGCA